MELSDVSLLVHKDKLYIRHSKVDKGFLLVGTEKMTIENNDTNLVELADTMTRERFCWTTDENAIKVNERGKRWMHCAPMASDGELIYTIVQWKRDGKDSERVCTMLEVYSFEKNTLQFKKEIELLDENSESWVAKKNYDHEIKDYSGDYFDFGSMACNGTYMVWMSKFNVHIFDIRTGVR